MTLKEMSHLLKRTKKSCIKLIRKLSTKQIFLKRLEEEDIATDIDISIEAKERNSNENENASSPKNSSYRGQTKKENIEDARRKNKANGKILSHLEEEEEDEEEESPNTAVLQSLTQKLFLTADGYEFQRLEQLRSDTASEIVPFDSYFAASAAATKKPAFAEETNLEVVFEKVKYKEDVRYLRHTPSTASLDNYTINDDIDYYITNSITTTTTNTNTNTTTLTHNNNCNMPNLNDSFFTNRGLETHRNYFNSQNHLNTNLLPVNVSLGCKTDGNYHQFIIGEERDCFYKLTPVVRWDINGNSLEDDFDNFHQINTNANNSPTKSSLRSSSTTLETWLDDE